MAGHTELATVSEADRSRAILRLRDAYAADELSVEQLSQALDHVLGARTHGELVRASPEREAPPRVSELSWRDLESLERHLLAGEAVLWTGRPEAGLTLPNARIRFRVWMAGGYVALIFFGNLVSGASAGTVLGASSFAVLVAYLVGRRYFFTNTGRRRLLYVITTERIARVARGRSGEQMDSVLLTSLPGISFAAAQHGRGTISFGVPLPSTSFDPRADRPRPAENDVFRFMNVPDAVHVARLISSLQAHQTNPNRRAAVNRPTGLHLKKH